MPQLRKKEYNTDLRMMETDDDRLKPAVELAKKLMSQRPIHESLRALLMGYQLQQWAFHELQLFIGNDKVMAELFLHHVQQAARQPFHEENIRDELRDRTLDFLSGRIIAHRHAIKKGKEKNNGDDESLRGDAPDTTPELREEDRGDQDPRVIQEEGNDREVPGRGMDEDPTGPDTASAGEPG